VSAETDPAARAAVPVIVLAGFLGSGKTTLLNHLLRTSRGTRIGAIVNDFGSIEIDAMTVAGQLGDSTVSLGNGCLCCAVDTEELDVFLDRLTGPSVSIDVIVIEASGLAEPAELVRMVLASDNERIRYGGLVEVVDAAEYESTRERHPEIGRHLALADLVVLNKTDRAEPAALERVRAAVGGAAAVVEAVHGRVDPELFFDPRPAAERVGQLSFEDLGDLDAAGGCDEAHGAAGHSGAGPCGGARGGADHLHTAYESLAFATGRPLHPRRLLDFLESRPAGLYRIKGFTGFGTADPHHRYTLHAVGRFLSFLPEPWPPGVERRTELVLIGSGIDREALAAGLEAAAVRGPEDAPDERSLWGVLRLVPGPRGDTEDDASGGGFAEPDRPLWWEEPPVPAAPPATGPAEGGTHTG
jgi:G3E family GTPase